MLGPLNQGLPRGLQSGIFTEQPLYQGGVFTAPRPSEQPRQGPALAPPWCSWLLGSPRTPGFTAQPSSRWGVGRVGPSPHSPAAHPKGCMRPSRSPTQVLVVRLLLTLEVQQAVAAPQLIHARGAHGFLVRLAVLHQQVADADTAARHAWQPGAPWSAGLPWCRESSPVSAGSQVHGGSSRCLLELGVSAPPPALAPATCLCRARPHQAQHPGSSLEADGRSRPGLGPKASSITLPRLGICLHGCLRPTLSGGNPSPSLSWSPTGRGCYTGGMDTMEVGLWVQYRMWPTHPTGLGQVWCGAALSLARGRWHSSGSGH